MIITIIKYLIYCDKLFGRRRERERRRRNKNVNGQLGNGILRDTTVKRSEMRERATKRREKSVWIITHPSADTRDAHVWGSGKKEKKKGAIRPINRFADHKRTALYCRSGYCVYN